MAQQVAPAEFSSHVADDQDCWVCLLADAWRYPMGCPCGGLVHANVGEPVADPAVPGAVERPVTFWCDRCGDREGP